ncbi:hypothetical protein CDG81_05245 [Actinopolyspora erythraea]|uniref:Uncharacterized protein n=1 Tax=Actinopolyspora erythraea TaxID=414996 RepID=A0A099D200_9ACTN|nr:hypothetical protein [Actinopolyspora erythraea]ASU77812.1 hypothetical protein CDG81_05245 [Actinopolyspora erythraea]KGI80029.1 hypothetical protein IL38_20235 [Actinopolyspora erythraea]
MNPSNRAGRVTAEVLRVLVAAGLLLSAVVHLELWAQGVREVAVIGPLFLLNAVAGLVLAMVLLGWKHWLPALGAVAFGVLTLAAFFVAVTIGLFGSEEVATGVPQLLAGVAEVVVVLAAIPLLVLGARG